MNPQPLHLVACVAGKLDRPAPACELYTSDWFRKARAYVETIGAPWRILSAKHGLVHPEQVLEPYNATLGELEHDWQRQAWGDQVALDLKLDNLLPAGGSIVFLAGQLYRDALTASPMFDRYAVSVPMQGLGLGEQKAWLARKAAEAYHARRKPAAPIVAEAMQRAPAQFGLELGGFGSKIQPALL
jgi:hypothetical protein